MQSLKWEIFSSQNNVGEPRTDWEVSTPVSTLGAAGPPCSSHPSTTGSACHIPSRKSPPSNAAVPSPDFGPRPEEELTPTDTAHNPLDFILLGSLLGPKLSQFPTSIQPLTLCASPQRGHGDAVGDHGKGSPGGWLCGAHWSPCG